MRRRDVLKALTAAAIAGVVPRVGRAAEADDLYDKHLARRACGHGVDTVDSRKVWLGVILDVVGKARRDTAVLADLSVDKLYFRK
mgnify:CR=1 FL=1